jgi:dTDP-4-dehydrorhamnose 3,5-epimerase
MKQLMLNKRSPSRSGVNSSVSTAIPKVVGGAEPRSKQSAVDAEGDLRARFIDDLVFRPTRPVPHEDGHITEVARASWEILATPIVQVHITTTLPGRVRAWGLHQTSMDRLFVVSGLVTIVVFDGCNDSPTQGRVSAFTVSEKNPGLLLIPPNLITAGRTSARARQ